MVLLEAFDGLGGQVISVGAGDLELAQQGEGLISEGLLHERGMVQVLGPQHLVESFGFGVDAALEPGSPEHHSQLGRGQPGRGPGVGAAASRARASGRSRPPRLAAKAVRMAG